MALLVVALAIVGSNATAAVKQGDSMGGISKNSYNMLMCEQDPTSWFCISNAQRENLIKLRRQGCTEMTCPKTHVYKTNVASLFCKAERAPTQMGQHMCDPEKDIPVCCDERAACESYECPYGWVYVNGYQNEFCAGPKCSFVDAGTCCETPEMECVEAKFKSTPDSDQFTIRPPATDLRTCRKDSVDAADGSASTSSSFLGTAESAEECFGLKLEQKSALGTTRVPTIPGPPGAGSMYGVPAPRPTQMTGEGRVIVDAASRGEEDSKCVGYNCEKGDGSYNKPSDEQWQAFLDISFNQISGECHSCTPERSEIGDPAAFGVSRDAETQLAVEGDQIFDCDCPENHFMKQGRCVRFVPIGDECFPNFGVAKSKEYFPCNSGEAICAQGTCVAIEEVVWDCSNDSACDPAQDNCNVVDECEVCGGDSLSCLDCEGTFQYFREQKQCRLAQDVDAFVAGPLQELKDKLGNAKHRANNPKSVAQREEAKLEVVQIEERDIPNAEAQLETLRLAIKTKVEETVATSAVGDARCWESVQNDCARPNMCLDGYYEECKDSFSAGDGCTMMYESTTEKMGLKAEVEAAEEAVSDAKAALVGVEEGDVRDGLVNELKEKENAVTAADKAYQAEVTSLVRQMEDIDGLAAKCFGCWGELKQVCTEACLGVEFTACQDKANSKFLKKRIAANAYEGDDAEALKVADEEALNNAVAAIAAAAGSLAGDKCEYIAQECLDTEPNVE